MSASASAVARGPRLQVWVGALVIGVLIFGLNFILTTSNNDQDRKAIAKITEVQVLSQQISKVASAAAGGNLDAFKDLKATRDNIEADLNAVRDGSAKDGISIVYKDSDAKDQLDKWAAAWKPVRDAADKIQARSELVLNITETANDFNSKIPQLTQRMDEIVRVLTDRNASGRQISMASRQMLLADRMLRRVSDILKGGDQAVGAADQFGRDAQMYGQVLNGMLNGSSELNIPALADPQARNVLSEVQNLFSEIGQNVDKIQSASTEMFEVTESADSINLDSQTLLEQSRNVAIAVGQLAGKRVFPNALIALLSGALILLALLAMGWLYSAGQRRQVRDTEALNKRNQDAILRLLDEMGSLAEGDLTVKATVTEDITGAIADSVNFAVEALRSLVTTINETAVQVAAAAQETQATAMHLAEAAEHQAQQITSASAAINEIAVSIDEVSKNSAESADVAQRSVQIATKGAEVVRQTIQGMDSIRDQIQETSKRIKRLGESSQEIGLIVEPVSYTHLRAHETDS